MKYKELTLAVILNAFLGYLWLLFMNHILNLTESLDNVAFKAMVFLVGTMLFGEIVRRITPFHEYKFTHPIRIAGICSCLVVVFIGVFIIDLG
jgi:hypothetical protein